MTMTIIAEFNPIKPDELSTDLDRIGAELKHEVECTSIDCHGARFKGEFRIQFDELRRCEMTIDEVIKLTDRVKDAFSKHALATVGVLTMIIDN